MSCIACPLELLRSSCSKLMFTVQSVYWGTALACSVSRLGQVGDEEFPSEQVRWSNYLEGEHAGDSAASHWLLFSALMAAL